MIQKYPELKDDLHLIRTVGLPQGFDLGWENVKQHFRPMQGYFCVMTGIPGHGKSEFCDCMIVNTILMHEWKWAIFSPENYPTALHFNKLCEKIIGKPQKGAKKEEYEEATQTIDDHATWLYPETEDVTLKELLDTVKKIKKKHGLDAFVFDPWNEITRPSDIKETDFIEDALRKFRRFCREHELFGIIIAHPTKMVPNREGKMPPVNLWSISGSSHWRNKCDFGIVVHREDMTQNMPTVDIQKVKQKNFGKVGKIQMYYDYLSGRMKDNNDVEGAFPMPASYGCPF
jgi:twinkle protein